MRKHILRISNFHLFNFKPVNTLGNGVMLLGIALCDCSFIQTFNISMQSIDHIKAVNLTSFRFIFSSTTDLRIL